MLSAALQVLTERGYASFSMDEVIRRSGVSRPTVYSRWASKPVLVTAALVATVPPLQVAHGGEDALQRLVETAALFVERLSHWDGGRAVLALHADPPSSELVTLMATEYWGPRARIVEDLVAAAQNSGQLRSDIAIDAIRDLVFGPAIYRWIITGKPVTRAKAAQSIYYAVEGLRTHGKAPPPPHE